MTGRTLIRWLSVVLVLSIAAAGCMPPGAAPAPGGAPAQVSTTSAQATAPALTSAPAQAAPTRVPATARPPTQAPPPTEAPPTEAPATQAPEPTQPAPTEPAPAADDQVVGELREEIWVNWIMPVIMQCQEPPQGQEWPATQWFQGEGLDGALCLWGFPQGDEIAVEIYEPGGERVGAGPVPVLESISDVGVASVSFTTAGLPLGQWRVVAQGSRMRLDEAFEVAPARMPVLYAVPPGSRDILAPAASPLAAGDALVILGAGMPPGRALPLGIYRGYEEDMMRERLALVASFAVTADAAGQFAAQIGVEESDAPGRYYAIVQIEPGYEPDPTGLFRDPAGAIASFQIGPR